MRQQLWRLAAAVVFVVGVVVMAVVIGRLGDEPTAVADEPELTPIEQARQDCRFPASAVGDSGDTLVVDHKGEDDVDGVSIDQVACALFELGTPDSIVARLDSTRAIDGVQTGSWDGYAITWSYHPDSGLNLIIESE